MKIIRATIENYRSIENLDIDLSEVGGKTCRILAGINESGKSNILKALSLLSPTSTVSWTKDVNKKARTEKGNIRVRYQLEDSSIILLKEHLSSKGVPVELIDNLDIEKVERIVSFSPTSARTDHYYIWLRQTPSLPTKYQYSKSAGKFIPASEESGEQVISPQPVSAAAIPTPTPAPDTDDIKKLSSKDEWESVLENYYAKSALENEIPNIIFWTYKEKYLINTAIDLTAFANNPSEASKPLHNVFNLAGYSDALIPGVIKDALADEALLGELSDNLAKAITDYISEVWPEHKVDIKVHPSNPNISFHVVERGAASGGRYEVAERSDGFKHFFAILLNFAAENSTSQLKDCLILLDEPEVHLHPSGAKFLRDELLKIASGNTVVYSTHSIFMIDRQSLDRHYKVQKREEITMLEQIDENNPFKEELIYESLGTSVLDLISEHNLMVEGLTDKKLLEAFTKKFKSDIKPLDINIINVDGEGHFDKYCKFFNQKNINGYILTDSDADGRNAKVRILTENNPKYNGLNTFEINDIVDTGKKSTLEDLLPPEIIEECIKNQHGVTLVLNSSKTLKEQIDSYNSGSATPKIDLKKLKLTICDYVCTDITKARSSKAVVEAKYPLYHEFVTKLHEKLKASTV